MTLKRAWHSILAVVDGQIEREIDKSLADKPIPLPREVAMPLMGADPAKMLATTEVARDKAEIRKQAIEREIARLNGELANTILAMEAATAAIGVLRHSLDNLPTMMPDAELEKVLAETDMDFEPHPDQTSPMTVERERYVTGHTSSERRLEEYAGTITSEELLRRTADSASAIADSSNRHA